MTYIVQGNYDINRAGHPESYFRERYTFIDFRGDLLISPLSNWGYNNTIITASHDISGGAWTEPMIMKSVRVEDYAWITSNCTLYDCRIGHHAILAIGAVVAHMNVDAYTMVAGNPARVVARWDGGRWCKVE